MSEETLLTIPASRMKALDVSDEGIVLSLAFGENLLYLTMTLQAGHNNGPETMEIEHAEHSSGPESNQGGTGIL